MVIKHGLGGTLIKMSIYTPPSLTGGADQTLVEVATAVPSLIFGLLVFVWGFVFLSGMATQRARTGWSDAPMWVMMASLSTLMITLLLSIKEGLMTLEVLSAVLAICLFSGLWLFLSKGRGEF